MTPNCLSHEALQVDMTKISNDLHSDKIRAYDFISKFPNNRRIAGDDYCHLDLTVHLHSLCTPLYRKTSSAS
jgi:hypothetical protein